MSDYDYILTIGQSEAEIDFISLRKKGIIKDYYVYQNTGTVSCQDANELINIIEELIEKSKVKYDFINSGNLLDDCRILKELNNRGYLIGSNKTIISGRVMTVNLKTKNEIATIQSLLNDGYTIKKENGQIIVLTNK